MQFARAQVSSFEPEEKEGTMVNIRLLLATGIAIGALACGDDESDSGACRDQSDESAVNSEAFPLYYAGCLESAEMNTVLSVTTCMQIDPPGLTEFCADCYGEYAGCTAENCSTTCLDSFDETECGECLLASCNDALEGCSGLSPPALVAPASCVNAPDLQAVLASSFPAEYQACFEGRDDMDIVLSVAACMEVTPPGLTMACADCYGSYAGCTVENCEDTCVTSLDVTECAECLLASCDPSFDSCSGVEPPPVLEPTQ